MDKFKYNPEEYSKALEWAKTYIIEEGKTLHDAVRSLPNSEEKLHFINRYIN